MRRSGSPSWSLSVSDAATLDLALFVRDAVGLDTSDDPLAPPPLASRPPDHSDLLDGQSRTEVARQWAAWWRAALAFETRWRRAASGSDLRSWVAAREEDEARTVGTAPDFAVLAGSPELQQVVVALHEEARRWPGRADGDREPDSRYELTRTIAEETIGRYGVSPDRVNGIVLVVLVGGVWWRSVEPGVVVCSAAALKDARTTAELLREAFESGLAGPSGR
ncbi:hypothetical protein [Georgenia daeguensis]|uniref:Uncharacterized protein n=1 Tax=Georgenia daeguensis TaxID=908355 RepID=A0ABP8ER20_9MICO